MRRYIADPGLARAVAAMIGDWLAVLHGQGSVTSHCPFCCHVHATYQAGRWSAVHDVQTVMVESQQGCWG